MKNFLYLGMMATTILVLGAGCSSTEKIDDIITLNNEYTIVQLAENVPVEITLDKQYALYVQDFFEGGYVADIDIVKKIADAYFEDTGVEIKLAIREHDTEKTIAQTPLSLLENAQINVWYPENIEETTLFGNTAVRYMDDNTVYVVGYLTGEQTNYPYSEAPTLVVVRYGTYGKAVTEDIDFFQAVVNSLTVK